MATDYELVNAASQLEAGAKYVIGSADVTSAVFMGTKDNKNNRVQTPEVAITDGKITLTDTILVLELGGEADAWTFQTQNYHGTNGYLSNASSGTTNACFVQEAAMSFTIAFDGNKAVITSNGGNARNIMRYNSGSKCFACYASGQKDIYLYKEVASQGGEEPVVEPTTKTIYCSPFSEWHNDGARFAVYAYGDGDNTAWYDLVAVEGAENVYSAEIAEAFPTVIFCRMNGATTENSWDNKWNQTADLTLPTDGKNLYTITGWNENDGEWSVYGEEPVVVEPTLANGFYLIGKINGVEGWTAANLSADRKFEGNPENNAEFVLTATLAEGDEIKVVNVLNDAITAWYPEGGNYVIDAAHAGEKDIYFRPDLQGGEDWFGACIYIAANEEPQPVEVDFTKPFTLLFNGTGVSGSDNSNAYAAEVDAIFTAETKGYVASVETAEKVFAGRPIAEDNSSLKFGTSSVKGTLAFTLGQEIEVDSIIVNATQYGKGAAEVTVNGVKFDLTAGNKVPTDCKITPEGKVSAITIAQTGSERIYLRYVKVYPKQAGEEPVVEPAKFYITGDSALVVNAGLDKAKAWNPDAIKSTETSYKLNLAAGDYKLKVVVGEGEAAQWKGFDALTTTADGLTADEDGNICFTLAEAGEVNVHYDGEFFFLTGDFYVAPVVVKYYLKNNWGSEAWSWKEMTDLGDGTYMLYNVVVGGEGVNRNTAESDEGASWFTWADIETFDASYEPATIGALDTVVIYFDPEAVNSFTGANGMSAQILGKYVAPVEPQGCDWENIEFLGGPAENANQFKVCKPENVGVVNIQNPNWSEKTQMGIYMTFPSAAFGEISLDEALYEKQGAGILFFLSAFTAQETEFVVNCDGNDLVITVYNANGGTPQPAHTYTVAGSSDVAFGTTWDPANAANDMEMSDDGIYVWERTELTLPKGTIMFKVCEDHAWTVAYPAQDYELAIPEAGIYTVWIHFDPANSNHVSAEAIKTGSAVVLPTIAMHGNFTGSWVDTENFAVAEGNETASLTLDLAAGNYEFGMRIGGSGNWTANGVSFTRENASAEVVAGNGNLKLVADVEGEYTFTWTFATNTLAITFPEGGVIPEPTLANGYYLIGKLEGVEGWNVESLSADRLFSANETNEGEYVLNATLAEGDAFKVVYVYNDAILTWFPEGDNYVVDQNHAGTTDIYFRPDYQGGEDWYAHCIFVVPTGTVDIDAVDANAPAVKVLRNGQIFIIKGDKTYNVMGAIVR